MDTRNYDEPFDCGLGACDCREDNTCGCTFPNNVSDMECVNPQQQSTLSVETCQSESDTSYVQKDSVCICGPQGCDCKVERNEVSL